MRIDAAPSLQHRRTARLQRSRGVQAGTGCHEGGIILSKKPPEWYLSPPHPVVTLSAISLPQRHSSATKSFRNDIHPQQPPAAKTFIRNNLLPQRHPDYHPRVLTRRDDCHRGEQGGKARRRRACPPPDTGRGRGPSAASYRAAMTQMTMGGAGVSAANGVPPVPGLPPCVPASSPTLPPTTP